MYQGPRFYHRVVGTWVRAQLLYPDVTIVYNQVRQALKVLDSLNIERYFMAHGVLPRTVTRVAILINITWNLELNYYTFRYNIIMEKQPRYFMALGVLPRAATKVANPTNITWNLELKYY